MEHHRHEAADRFSSGGQSDTSTLIPLRFMGVGVFVAWLCCMHISSIYTAYSGSTGHIIDYGLRVGDIGTFLVMALLASRIGPLSRRSAPCSVLVIITTLGTALIGLVLAPQGAGEVVLFVAAVITGIGGAVLFCLWAEVYCQMGSVRMVGYVGSSCVLALLIYLLFSTMEQPYAIIATSLLPVISLACAWLSFRIVPRERVRTSSNEAAGASAGTGTSGASVGYHVPWRLIAIMGLAGVASGFTGTILGDIVSVGAVHRIWSTGLVGLLLALATFAWSKPFDMRLMSKICLVSAIAAFLLVPTVYVFGEGMARVVSLLVKFAFVWFAAFVLVLLAHIAFRFEIPSLRLSAIARAASEGGILVGLFMRDGVNSFIVGFNVPELVVGSCFGLVIVGVCVLIWRSEKAVNDGWGAAGISLESGERVLGPRERMVLRCERLAEQYDLTERETDMLKLIAAGKTRSEIEQELFLSQNTVKTHTRHLYAKLGVHSREEVRKLVNG